MAQDDLESLLRILDANWNRAAEALRAVEDICRFHWNSRGFAGDLKEIRHAVLAAVTLAAGPGQLLLSRDVEGDAGRDNASPSHPGGPAEIAFRNLSRAKEAFRVIEEVCRVLKLEAAPGVERARYRLYAIEKGLAHLASPNTLGVRLRESRLCLLATRKHSRQPLRDVVAAALDAGADMIQLLEKRTDATDREMLEAALELREITARSGALFLVNDRADIARLAAADGVHLGQDDLSPQEARRILGAGAVVGVSTHSPSQARDAERRGADYIGAGPMFPTSTKDAGPLLGPGGLRDVLAAVSIPVFAIGGITAERVPLLVQSGATRLAVSSAVLAAEDVRAAVKSLQSGLSRAPAAE